MNSPPFFSFRGMVVFSLYVGVDTNGKIRSLPLPNLNAVTRQSAKEYFDNSWTLFETLFAGLKGEEPFYRYVNLYKSSQRSISA
jgi:hypothetical protein